MNTLLNKIKARQFAQQIKGKLIVSCQALADEPLFGPHIMAKVAQAAKIGGAVAIRSNGPDDIRAIRAALDLPIIGLFKDGDTGVYITPSFDHARAIAEAGADVIALDCTQRPRPDGSSIQENIAKIQEVLVKPVVADVATLEEGIKAIEAGADFVAPTLSGYTEYSPAQDGPDFELLTALIKMEAVPIIAEGKIHTPQQAKEALELGAWAVVVGSAITRPRTITARFVAAIEQAGL